jgi:hypothetical protein
MVFSKGFFMFNRFRERLQRSIAVSISSLLAIILLSGVAPRARQKSATAPGPESAVLSATDEVLKVVSRLRGLAVLQPVKSGLKTHDEIEQSVVKDLDENTKPEEFEATSKILTKLGLIPRGFQLRDYMVKLLREQVAGYYEAKTKEFYLAAWVPISEQKTVMAHELTHALQDQHFNLKRFEKWPKGDSDAELAIHSLIEGDATVVMFEYTAEQEGVHLDITKIPSLKDQMLKQDESGDSARYPVLAGAPMVLRENLQFPYIYGTGFVQEVLKNLSWEQLNGSYTKLIASSEQIMHPERFLAGDAPVKVSIPDLAPVLGHNWKKLEEDVNGEFGYMVLLAQFLGRPAASIAAEGWGGDKFAAYENKQNGAVVIAQSTTWDTAADAREFFDAYSERTNKRYNIAGSNPRPDQSLFETSEGLVLIELRGKDVLIVEGAENRAQLASLFELLWKKR